MNLPFRSKTVTGNVTKFVSTLIISSSTSGTVIGGGGGNSVEGAFAVVPSTKTGGRRFLLLFLVSFIRTGRFFIVEEVAVEVGADLVLEGVFEVVLAAGIFTTLGRVFLLDWANIDKQNTPRNIEATAIFLILFSKQFNYLSKTRKVSLARIVKSLFKMPGKSIKTTSRTTFKILNKPL